MTIDHAHCIPVLPSADIDATLAFYRDRLGFAGEALGDYAIVRRDAMELHFQLARGSAAQASCYIRGGQVPALFAEFSTRHVPGLTAFEVKPWNMKEFAVTDPHGNLLRFGCAPQEIADHP